MHRGCHAGIGKSGMYGITADEVWRILNCDGFGEGPNTPFCRVVGGGAGATDNAVD